MTKDSIRVRRPARREDITALVRDISPLETAALDDGERAALGGALLSAAVRCRTYTLLLDGRLAGVCFIEDLPDRREMAFTKTRYLTEERKLSFARWIPRLLDLLAECEAVGGRDKKPMYMHVPEGDERSLSWFLRAGCVETEHGLLCPQNRKDV